MITILSKAGAVLLQIEVDDTSYVLKEIMGENSLTLNYALPEHVELPVGAYCVFEGETYTLMSPEALKMQHTRDFEYTVTFEGAQAKAKLWKFRNPVDGRLSFSLTATPREHLQMLVDNLNRRDSGWSVGDCITSAEKVISYDHSTCYEALQAMSNTFETEWEIVGKRVSLRKVEYYKGSPLALSYGRGNGFKPGVGRSNFSNSPAAEILLPQGGSRNIDASAYGSPELLLPKSGSIRYDGDHFEGESGFSASRARTYVTDADGRSLYRYGRTFETYAEESLDCSEYYPKRVGTVSAVEVIDAHLYDIIDTSIPAELNFSDEDVIIGDETLTIIFQSGELAGREFDVRYVHTKDEGGVEVPERRFEIVPATIDTIEMPGGSFVPKVGDKYVVYHFALPQAYICNDGTKTGASWDMFKAGVKYLYDHEDQLFSFTGELDGIWAKRNWVNVGSKIRLGGFISFTDERFQHAPALVRIIRVRRSVNNPYSPVIELSNATVSGGFSSTIKELESAEVVVEDRHKDAISFTKRRFRDAMETMDMLSAAIKGYTDGISPIAIHTMQLLVGDESLQFRFVNSKTTPVTVNHDITYNSASKVLTAPSGIIQHMTLGISSLSSSHAASDYKYWDVSAFESARLEEASKRYYLYAKVSKTAETGVFVLSEAPIDLNGVSGHYHLLVGLLGTEVDGERSFVTLYGFTEILPGRITTDKVMSGSGDSYFDMVANAMKLGDSLDYNSQGDGKLRIKGTIVQSESGDESPIGVFRGTYKSTYTYYNGDEVSYTANSVVSTYRCISANPIVGKTPTNTTYWMPISTGGVRGDTGPAGNFTEYRYAVNGSRSAAPTLSASSRNPSGWTTTQGTVGELQYLWMTSAGISGANNTLVSNWKTPVRVTPYDGKDGKDGEPGADGGRGVSPVFRGDYDSSKTYVGNSLRADVVKYNNQWWIAAVGKGSFSGRTPSSTSEYWNDFGGNYESIATGLLLAESANIAGFVFKYIDGIGKMWSQWGVAGGKDTNDPSAAGYVPNIEMDGVNGYVKTGSGVFLRREGLEISNQFTKTLVRNQSISNMITSLISTGDAGTVTIPTSSSKTLSLAAGNSYSLTADSMVKWTHNSQVVVVGRSSSQLDIEIYLNVMLRIERTTGSVVSNTLLFSARDVVYSEFDDERDVTGVTKIKNTSGSVKVSASKVFTIPSGCRAVLVAELGTSLNGACSSYACANGTFTVVSPADWYVSGRRWTLIGNDGIYVAKDGASVRISNESSDLSFIVKGLPGAASGTSGQLYVDQNGNLKVS